MIYLIDSNTFMTAARTFYSFDFGDTFWNFLVDKASQNLIKSIDKVWDEIKDGEDKLKQWAQEQFSKHFLSTQSNQVFKSYKELVQWAETQQQYSRNAKNEFMKEKNADAWLIAFARQSNDYCIVTFEKLNPNIQRKIPIPNVCNAFNIQFCDLYEMLKKLNFQF